MIFAAAQSDKRAIIFFDEIDSIASSRETDTNGVGKRLVAQLLTLMDGFESKGNVVVVAATNRIEDVDPACCARGVSIGRFRSRCRASMTVCVSCRCRPHRCRARASCR